MDVSNWGEYKNLPPSLKRMVIFEKIFRALSFLIRWFGRFVGGLGLILLIGTNYGWGDFELGTTLVLCYLILRKKSEDD